MQREFRAGAGNQLNGGLHVIGQREVKRFKLQVKTNWLSGGLHFLIVVVALQFESVEVWPYALAAMSLVSFAAWIGNYRRMRFISDTPTSRVASAAQGYVELTGSADHLPGAKLLSKLSQVPCNWYSYSISRKNNDNKWSHVESGESADPFLVRDDTGLCVIDPQGAEIITSHQRTWTSGSYRYTECMLLPQDNLYAIGEFATISGANAGIDHSAEFNELLNQWKKNQPDLLKRFDLDRDGTLDLKEWELARRQARREVAAKPRDIAATEGTHLLRCPADDRLFLISNHLPDELRRRFHIWSWVHIAIFLGTGAAAFALF